MPNGKGNRLRLNMLRHMLKNIDLEQLANPVPRQIFDACIHRQAIIARNPRSLRYESPLHLLPTSAHRARHWQEGSAPF
jgi:hypothetical protein